MERKDVRKAYGEPRLVNRGDGVDGHYCIGREHPNGYYEFWDNDKQKWTSAGSVLKLGAVKSLVEEE